MKVKPKNKEAEIDYFPFTHGDLIENQRKLLSQMQQQEVVKAINQKRMEKAHLHKL